LFDFIIRTVSKRDTLQLDVNNQRDRSIVLLDNISFKENSIHIGLGRNYIANCPIIC
jgi:hypothetical protein